MYKIKTFIKYIFSETTWFFANLLLKFIKKNEDDSILLIPAANLNGGFGEDIMILSFLKNFAKSRPVTILTGINITREDYYEISRNITFVSGFSKDKVNFIKLTYLIKNHSLVYVIGADILDGTYSEPTAINRLRLIEIAQKLKIDAQFSGFSVSNKMTSSVKRKFVEISQLIPIKLRDIESYERMKSFIPEDRLILTNDIAFICPDIPAMYEDNVFETYKVWIESVKNKSCKIVAICPNSIQANKYGLDRYIEGFKALLNYFIDKEKMAFVFLYHDLRPLCGTENDSTISKKLYEYFTEKKVNCFYTDTIKNGIQLKGFLSLTDFSVTGRMHLGISGITYGKPMFGVAYANKFEGMVKLFKIDPMNCLVDYDKMTQARTVVHKFINELPNSEKQISDNLNEVKKNTLKNYT